MLGGRCISGPCRESVRRLGRGACHNCRCKHRLVAVIMVLVNIDLTAFRLASLVEAEWHLGSSTRKDRQIGISVVYYLTSEAREKVLFDADTSFGVNLSFKCV